MLALRVPPPIYAALSALLMWLLHTYVPMVSLVLSPWNLVGWAFVLTGLAIDLWSVGLFWKDKTTINPLKPDHTETIVVRGMYAYSRNPMYLGMLFILIGIAIILGTLSPLLVLPVFVVLITKFQIEPEELSLTNKFAQEYLSYKRRVRRWL